MQSTCYDNIKLIRAPDGNSIDKSGELIQDYVMDIMRTIKDKNRKVKVTQNPYYLQEAFKED